MSERKVCVSCGQQLGNTAFYRHLRDSSGLACPGKRVPREENEGEDSSDFSLDLSTSEVESSSSSFSINSSDCDIEDCDDNDIAANSFVDDNADCHFDSDAAESELTSLTDSSSGEEIWEDLPSSSCDDENQPDNSEERDALYGISVFLNFIHLTFRLSERAMLTLILFIKILFKYISSLIGGNKQVDGLIKIFPKSLYGIRKLIPGDYELTEYVVCPKCYCLYSPSECIIEVRRALTSKQCDYVSFPNHKHISRHTKCGTTLMKQVRVGKKTKLVPRKLFVYQSIISCLKRFVNRKGFLQRCEHWRDRTMPRNMLGDIYDGKLWKDLNSIDGVPFLASHGCLCLTMNIDWFNPFKEAPYSAGAIYLVIQNLPRTERYKLENVILVGLIPGPREPKCNINIFLKPLVKELGELYHGVKLKNSDSIFGETKVRAVLSCVLCDLPATRKVCGFLSYNAKFGCSKCLKQFPKEHLSKNNFSGYDIKNWPQRDSKTHIDKALAAMQANTADSRASIESSYGARYSELFSLSYYDVIRYHVVDPMHNLFLGIAKHAVKTWRSLGVLKEKDFEILQCKVDSINPPAGIVRIPRKIGSAFSSFTADEWKHWTLLYSVYALRGVLPEDDYRCWCVFVDACRILCQLTITTDEVHDAHCLIVAYCNRFVELYGPMECTPNMHMACHLQTNLLDYGPLAAFWAFSFERYNGTLEGLQKSWNGPEKQMFKKFLDLQAITVGHASGSCNSLLNMMFASALLTPSTSSSGNFSSFNQTSMNSLYLVEQTVYHVCPVRSLDATLKEKYLLSQPKREKCFNPQEMKDIEQMYRTLYPESDSFKPSHFYYESKQVFVNGEEYISTQSRSKRSSAIVAHWGNEHSRGIDSTGTLPLRVGVVNTFISHQVTFQSSGKTSSKVHCLARISWLEDHPQRSFFHPSIIVTSNLFDDPSPASFMPVARICARCAVLSNLKYTFDYGEDNVCLSIPLFKKIGV